MKEWFKRGGKWTDNEQRIFCWGFITAFFLTNAGYGLGVLINYLMGGK